MLTPSHSGGNTAMLCYWSTHLFLEFESWHPLAVRLSRLKWYLQYCHQSIKCIFQIIEVGCQGSLFGKLLGQSLPLAGLLAAWSIDELVGKLVLRWLQLGLIYRLRGSGAGRIAWRFFQKQQWHLVFLNKRSGFESCFLNAHYKGGRKQLFSFELVLSLKGLNRCLNMPIAP